MTLSPELLAACRLELDAWAANRQRGNNLPDSPHRQNARRAPRPCSCGCGDVEWNRTGMCQAAYSRRRRTKERGQRRIMREPRRLCRHCPQARKVVSHGRCNPCYQHWRQLNPKLCDCGNYFGGEGRRGIKCPRCVKRTTLDTYGRCACGNAARYASGKCHRCQSESFPMCPCGQGRVRSRGAEKCYSCYRETYEKRPHVAALRKRRSFRRMKARRLQLVVHRKPRSLCRCGLEHAVARGLGAKCYTIWRYWTRRAQSASYHRKARPGWIDEVSRETAA